MVIRPNLCLLCKNNSAHWWYVFYACMVNVLFGFFSMPRSLGLLDSEIREYLEKLDDSEDGLDGSDSEPEDEDEMNEDPPLVTEDTENAQEQEDPPLEESNDEEVSIPGAPQRNRPLLWKKRNLVTNEDDLVFRGNTQIPEALLNCNTPFEFFSYFFTPNLKKEIVYESNLYATQKQISNPETINENILNKFLGILVFTSVIKFPNTRLYWSDKFGYDLIKNTMSQKKFEKVRSIIHFADNTKCLPKEHPDYDRLYRIRPLIETLNHVFGTVPMDQRLSIDEQMCATKMSHYIKQYLPNKPHKWGFKLYLICSLQGYAHKFELYAGGGNKNTASLPGEPDLGESGNTVIRLARMVPRHVNHIIYFDNFYTSLPLLTYLAKEGIYSLGTVRVNRVRNSKLPDKRTIMKKNVARGFYEENVANVDGTEVSAVVWKDNKPVNLLSTYVGAEPATTVSRFDKRRKERVEIPCPKIIREYNTHMGGVDLLDSFIGRYHITMKSRKWTMRLFYHFLDLCVINSWVMYKKVHNQLGTSKLLNLAQFRLDVAETLCQTGLPISGCKRGRPSTSSIQAQLEMKRSRTSAQSVPSKNVRLDQTSHWSVWLEKQQRCKYPKCTGYTFKKCEKCQVSLCDTKQKNCYYKYHTE
ncbi:piggyBac transposable element-derived protein 3-like [Chrysoperla carnea]|uniref:piggyBac transposable element-derived protein 3-like n=1 Tax=Chrysoperla carnea TaxID=189513 RepID=UPI001D07415B|nr:piggyBac transposable element-derived protein 3-like [Chrysoperla carnea]XP_044734243.1 piggyBac transposable element-derived protein 3-like [Chrysoperla carnea]XP_044736381.1 piggyBac transposable element-derived protein 3-like [Chrysoperla carnea]XP_044738296.1 piggyBac transposable element-derived protein 3-like [Chrysoperla carnea]